MKHMLVMLLMWLPGALCAQIDTVTKIYIAKSGLVRVSNYLYKKDTVTSQWIGVVDPSGYTMRLFFEGKKSVISFGYFPDPLILTFDVARKWPIKRKLPLQMYLGANVLIRKEKELSFLGVLAGVRYTHKDMQLGLQCSPGILSYWNPKYEHEFEMLLGCFFRYSLSNARHVVTPTLKK